MIVLDTLRMAFIEFRSNKLRTALTMLGIIIGVGAVIALMAAGQGAQAGVTNRVQGLGSNLIFIKPAQTQTGGGALNAAALTLTTDDADTLRNSTRYPEIEAVVSQFGGASTTADTSQTTLQAPLIANNRNTSAIITATEPDFAMVRGYTLAAGSFITADDMTSRTTNVVLGAKLAADLFDTPANALGQEARISFGPFSLNMTVVGVLNARGGSTDDDRQLILPLSTFRQRVPFLRNARGNNNVQQITVKVVSSGKLDQAKQDITQALLANHNFTQDFTVSTQDDLLTTARQVSRTLTILLGAIAGISLVVGGIGIMNIMLVSVIERTREIGIRKAVGADQGNILMQFVIEAVIVTVLGGALGVIIGITAARLANGQDFGTGSTITTQVTPLSVAVASGVSVLTGLFFGIYPAYQASRLDPIDALRSE